MKRRLIAVTLLTVIATGGVWYARQQLITTTMQLEQEASGGGQLEREEFRRHVASGQKSTAKPVEINDFPEAPSKLENGILVPVDPVRRKKQEQAIENGEIILMLNKAVWLPPAVGLVLLFLVWERGRRTENASLEELIELERMKHGSSNPVPDLHGGNGDLDGLPAQGEKLVETEAEGLARHAADEVGQAERLHDS